MFLIVFLVLETTLYGYPTWRVLSAAPWSPMVNAIVIAGVVLTALATPVYVLTIRASSLSRAVREALAWVAYMLLAVAGVIFGLFVARDAIWLGIWLLGFVVEGFDLVFLPASIHLLNLSILGAACLLTIYGAIGAHRTPRVRHVEIPIDDLPVALESLRIVQLTDLHVGPTIKRPFVSRVVDATNALQPDLIVFTGDLADGTATGLAHDVAPLADLQCRFGPYFVTGNHEYYSDPSGWMQALPGLGFDVLLNEHRSIEWVSPLGERSSPLAERSSPLAERSSPTTGGSSPSPEAARLVIGGVPDPNGAEYEDALPGHRPDPQAVFRDAPEGVRLLLAHQPRSGVDAIEATGAALTLSGHTHGGQLGLWRYLVRLLQPVVSGLARRCGAWIYVSRGVGYWGPPCRLGAPSEITCLRLVRA